MKQVLDLAKLATTKFQDYAKKFPDLKENFDPDELRNFAIESGKFTENCSNVIDKFRKLLENGQKLNEKATSLLKPEESNWNEWDNQQLILFVQIFMIGQESVF